jgi:two-component SAPR family response regulator
LEPVAVRFFTGEIAAHGRTIVLPDKEAQLLFTVASAETAINVDKLLDRLWPDADGDSARNSFRVCLYRLRRHIGAGPLVTHLSHNYVLCDNVEVDLHRLRSALRCYPSVPEPLEMFYYAIVDGRPARSETGGWFDFSNAVVLHYFRKCVYTLCSAALLSQSFARAAAYARELLCDVPDDERALEILAQCNAAVTVPRAY